MVLKTNSFRILLACYSDGWKKTFTYKGCATRKEFWIFILVNLFVFNIFSFINKMMAVAGNGLLDILLVVSTGFSLQVLFMVILIIPSMSLGIRRMHDIGRSGWWFSSLLVGNIFIIPAFLGALVSSVANKFSWDLALQLTIWISLILNLSVISYLIYICTKHSINKNFNPHSRNQK